MGEESSLYRQRLHPFHFPLSWEASGPSSGCGVSVFNNYRQLIRWLFCIIDGFLFLNSAKSGCTVARRTFSRSHLTICQDGVLYHTLMWQDAFFKIMDRNCWRLNVPGDCTDHRALYARGLVDQSASLEISRTAPTTKHCTLGDWSTNLPVWKSRGLHRPPSTIRLGTGQPVCQFGNLWIAPTTKHYTLKDWSVQPTIKRYMLGDWLISPYDGKRA